MESSGPVLWPIIVVMARVLGDGLEPPPDLEDRAVVLVKRHHVEVGCGSDGGVLDAGVPEDAPDPDAGIPPDAGVPDDGGIPPDAGSDCTILDDAITMLVQPRVSNHVPGGMHFAMLFVTPSRPIVEAKEGAFDMLDAATAAEVVETEVEVEDPSLGQECAGCGSTRTTSSGGCGGGYQSPSWQPPGVDGTDNDGGVVLETVGPYAILRVQPADRAELVAWLDQTGFAYRDADVDAVVPYIARGFHVVAVRLAIATPMKGPSVPLAITWAGTALRLPLALSAARNVGETITVYTAADGTYAFPGAHVAFSGHTAYDESSYVTRNELTIPAIASPDEDPVATRVLPDLYYRDTVEHVTEVKVPVTVMCESNNDLGCCSASRDVRIDWMLLAVALIFVTRRRRR